ncbi:hypothetical protein ACO0RG_001297 [Hanseniaspora osmophila]|uniref:Signal recognition particle subunit SRP14 n=1 Tax=Hanseniaspora osmophila TaxID=56408 RepID=A0A1E5RP08_9ASCO|nr:Signal recognition particle subunit SRP14 [Hanseniaspora osmophila]
MSSHLSNEAFLLNTTSLFAEANKLHRNVRVSMKRIIPQNEVEKPKELDSSAHPEYDVSKMSRSYLQIKPKSSKISQKRYNILIRAVMGAGRGGKDCTKMKISTIIHPDHLDHFWQTYSANVKAGMTGLSKKKKKKGTASVGASKAGKDDKVTKKSIKKAKK